MADGISESAFGPVPVLASGITVSVTVQEVALMFSQNRTVLTPEGQPSGQQKPTWIAAYSLAPSTAAQLRDGLIMAIKQYEETFGKIPVDPHQKIEIKNTIPGG